jgi:hypothetical protein
MVRPGGLEPPARGLGNRCSVLLSYGRKINGAPGRNRTHSLLIRSQTLYPVELQAHINGGERGIRTLDTDFRPYNRLAGDRLRPTRPSLHVLANIYMAEGVGFEPTALSRH